uniref:Putative ovule protein n=1 Tax=Solanum chacoense TaxID=4108 RepID=A0A0V0HXG2_SOLCH
MECNFLLPPSHFMWYPLTWHGVYEKKSKTFEIYGLKQFLDICVVENHFIKDIMEILKLNYF